MGTSLSNLQILGAEESSVRAALPKAVVGRWSERFVTACPGELSFGPLNRTANQLSKRSPAPFWRCPSLTETRWI